MEVITYTCVQKWNKKLAKLARAWTEKCSYKHGTPAFSSDDVGYNTLGQNNWIGKVNQLDIKAVVQDWFSEKQYFDYNSLQCTPGQSCDRYTQVNSLIFSGLRNMV
jgi:Cysteine-rich secretory protein family